MDVSREEIDNFLEQANKHHATIRFTAEISETETTFLDKTVTAGPNHPFKGLSERGDFFSKMAAKTARRAVWVVIQGGKT